MSWKDRIHDALYEEQAPTAPTSTPAQTTASVNIRPQPISPLVPIFNAMAPSGLATSGDTDMPSGDIATKLAAKTDFDSTDIGRQLKEHLEPLAGLPLSEQQQMVAALKAGAKDGLTADKIIAELQNQLNVLDGEKSKFDAGLASATAKEVTQRQNDITAEAENTKNLEAQVTASRQRQSDLSAALIEAQTKLHGKDAEFQAAYTSRKGQIQQTIDHYNSILKG